MPIRIRNFELRDRGERVVETEPLLALRTGLQLRPRGLPQGDIELELSAVETHSETGAEIARTSSTARLRLSPGEWAVVSELPTSRPLRGSMTFELREEIEPERDELLLFRILPDPGSEPQVLRDPARERSRATRLRSGLSLRCAPPLWAACGRPLSFAFSPLEGRGLLL